VHAAKAADVAEAGHGLGKIVNETGTVHAGVGNPGSDIQLSGRESRAAASGI
jgi:hypothetical protein